jgi:hypothetical protein
MIKLGSDNDVKAFIGALGKLRVWEREPSVKM